MSVTRRSVVRGAAWSVPAVAVAAQAPAFAASPCSPVSLSSFTAPALVIGSLRAASGTNGLITNGVQRYQSEQDNTKDSTNTQNAANRTEFTVSTTLTLQVGRPYTFTFDVLSRYAADTIAKSQNQFLVVSLGGTDLLKLSKGVRNDTYVGDLATAGYTTLSTSTAGAVQQSFTAPTFTPTVASNTLIYRFILPALTGTVAANFGNADISISAPTITGC